MRFLATMGVAFLLCQNPAAEAQITKLTAPPEWSIGCDDRGHDQFGDRHRRYCWLALSNLGADSMIMDDNSWVIRYVNLIEIDATSFRLNKPKKTDTLCAGTPKRIAVDGVRIDHLPEAKQIEAIIQGHRLSWEEQRPWPTCGIAPHGTYLTGIGPAFGALLLRWKEINGE